MFWNIIMADYSKPQKERFCVAKIKKYIAATLALLILTVSAMTVPVYAADDSDSAPTQSVEESTAATDSQVETDPAPSESATEATEPEIVPGNIARIIVGRITDTSLTVKWSASENATGYNVYRAVEQADGKLGKYTLYKTLAERELNETGLEQATKYAYKVYACRNTDSYSTQSDCVSITALTKPSTVSGFKVTKKETNAVKMVWEKNERATKYVIYRADEKKNGTYSAYAPYKTLGKTKTEFTDKKLDAGRIYKYKIVAQRKKGDLISQSKGAALITITYLNAVTKLESPKQTTSSITLTWKKVKRADKYQVYRGKKLIKTVKKTKFTDKKLKNGKEYKYTVRAIRLYKGAPKKGVSTKLVVPTKVAIFSVAKGLSGTWV